MHARGSWSVAAALALLACQGCAGLEGAPAIGGCTDRSCSPVAPQGLGQGPEGEEDDVVKVELLQQELSAAKFLDVQADNVGAAYASTNAPTAASTNATTASTNATAASTNATTASTNATTASTAAAAGSPTAAAASATVTTTLPPTGMKLNAVGDLRAFISSAVVNIFCVGFGVVVLGIFRLRYPIMYSNNVIEHIAPDSPPETFFGWMRPTMGLTIDDVAQCITLDHALLLEFTHFSMKVLAAVGVPMVCVMGPVNWIFGGNAAGEDRLSYLSYGNIQMDSPLFWAHCFVVLYVVGVVTTMTHMAMRQFLKRRFKWLAQLSEHRANTVLIESIPPEFRSEERLRNFLGKVMPQAYVERVYVTKDTTDLLALVQSSDNAKFKLKEAEARLHKDPDSVPMVRDSYMGGQVEAIPYWREQISQLEPQVRNERQKLVEEAKVVGGVNLSTAFVTFADRSSAEVLLRLDRGLAADAEQWEIMHAPQPSDILWNDLTQDESAKSARTVIGYALVVGLYFIYMPCVIAITNLAKLVDFSKFGLAPIQPFWQGFAPTIGLQFMVAFLPTFLILIFKAFFTCRAEAWQQHKLQIWYFWFQVVFVLLATAIGQNVRAFTSTLVNKPTDIVRVLAETMPYATHFYMNFLVLQWMSHSMNLTRYFPLFKFKAALTLYEEKDAKAFAEPEDQDYYGIGSRSARWSTVMAISIVFGTLCPPINLLGILTFLLCRLVYGYLFVYAETRKADTGGAFWVTQLRHVFVATILYCILMIGVLIMRAKTYGPGIIAIAGLVWTIGSLIKFNAYSWERLPLQDLITEGVDPPTKQPSKGQYVQPEMVEG